jgi:uncharacterized protein YgiM (DUF1202 family)
MKNRKIAYLSFAIALGAGILNASEVRRNVYLRQEPSTHGEIVRLLMAGEDITAFSDNVENGYVRVETAQHERGYVWKRNLRLTEATLTQSASSTKISPDWKKPQADTEPFKMANDENCPPEGGNNDRETELRKNRQDSAKTPHDVSINSIVGLPYDHSAKTKRSGWTPRQLAEIAPFEGIPVRVAGYLVHFTEKTGKAVDQVRREGAENCNCGSKAPEDVDWHLSLVERPRLPEKQSIVVEVTPRIRALHDHKWTLAKMDPLVNSDIEVRITGWTMMDPEHELMVGTHRRTRWEIHPITEIEVKQGKQWVSLDEYQP